MNQYLEVTNLKAEATIRDIESLCDEAVQNNYASICVAPYYVTLASTLLKNTSVEISTVIGSSAGYQTSSVKSYGAIEAVQNGATEIGMYLNISAVKNNDFDYIQEEIEEVRDSIDGKVLKLIIDTSKLTEEELVKVIRISNETYIHYIEVNEMDKIDTILEHKGEVLELKVNTNATDILSILEKGVSRIGTTNGKSFMEGV